MPTTIAVTPKQDAASTHYDIVVVGSGAAGSVLANRLSAERNLKVALIEAGGSDKDAPQSFVADQWFDFQANIPEHHWELKSVKQEGLGGRVIDSSQAKMSCYRSTIASGCSSHNAGMYTRAHHLDYDEWATKFGCGKDWSWNTLVPYFRSLDSYEGKTVGPTRGTNGEMKVRQA